ncbi:MAG: ABC transporter permease [Planctomycetes bacterium]|nr:ABC transporter permease [Planctomycetota bacterium]
MRTHLMGRILLILPTLWGAATLVFFAAHLAPGGPARSLLGEKATPEKLQEVVHSQGWDDPLLVQYGRFLWNTFLHFEFGKSYFSQREVSEELARCFPATVELATAALLTAAVLGVGLGTLASLKPGHVGDMTCTSVSTLGVSVPVFFLGLLLLLAFRNLPMGDRHDLALEVESITGLRIPDAALAGDWEAVRDAARHLLLPALTLATVPLAVIARMTRSTMVEVLQSDYIRTARAKGLHPARVVLVHALPNAAVPIITVVGLQFGYLLAGAVLTESIFNWPGLGRYLTEAVHNRDFHAVQGATLLTVSVFLLVNLAADIACLWLDPRLRKEFR